MTVAEAAAAIKAGMASSLMIDWFDGDDPIYVLCPAAHGREGGMAATLAELYDIPWGVYRDPDGNPHFTINDETCRQRMIHEDLCSICGTKLFHGRWFVGGPRSAFDPNGCYIDPPLHRDCLVYAMTACPYLAAPNYDKRIEDATLRKTGHSTPLLIEQTMLPGRPEVFVAVMAIGQTSHTNGPQRYVTPKRPYHRIEYWRHGVALPEAEGAAMVAGILSEPLPEKRQPRLIISQARRRK